VAGQQGTNTTDWAVRKYDASGTLDATWGTGGMVNYSTAGGESATGIAADSAGSVYVAGRHAFNGTDWALKKYDLTGDLCEPLTVGTSQVCLYAVLDVGSGASAGELVDVAIADACTDITTSRGSVGPCGTTPLPGTTTLATAEVRVFYSIGTDVSDLKTGTPDITIAGGLATLDVGQTSDIGVGDVIDFDSPSTLVYIWDVVSPTQFHVQNADGSAATDVPGPGVSVNSIKRAFNSVSQAVTESSDANHLNNTDLVAANRRLTWVCYDDAAFNLSAPTTISGYTTDSTHFITLTVAGAAQVVTGNSQRHRGFAGNGVRFEASAGATTFLSVTEPYTRVEWVEFDGNDVGTTEGIVLEGTADSSLVSGVMLHNLTGTPGNETNTASGVFISSGNDASEVRNSIIYAYDGDGVHVSGSNVIVANSTFYLGRTTPSSNSVQTDTGAGVTASVFNVLAVGPETDFWENTAGGLSLYNSITTDSSACDFDVSGSCLTGVQPETEFISLAGIINLHLRGGARAIDFGQTLGTFSNDVDDDARPQGAAYDAGADESFFSSAITYYRSIGTAPDLVNEGTITVTAGSSTVTKVGGLGWLAQNRGRGDVVIVNGSDQYMIIAVVSDDVLTLASLPTTSYTGGTYTIARQFSTLAAWEACIDGQGGSPPPAAPCFYFPAPTSSLVADARAEIGIAYADSDFVLGSTFEINDSTTDTVHSIRLTADGTNRHNGSPGGGVVIDANLGPSHVIVRDGNVTLEWLELKGQRGADNSALIRVGDPGTTNVLLQDLLLHDYYDPTTSPSVINQGGIRLTGSAGKGVTVRNVMIWDGDNEGIRGDEPGDTLIIENCSIDDIRDTSGGTRRGVFADNQTGVVVRNTISTRNGNDFSAGSGSFDAVTWPPTSS
jgi:hypothetical protein